MIKYDRNYLKNTMLLSKYFLSDNLILYRFKDIKELYTKLDNDFKEYGLSVLSYDYKDGYEMNNTQDYELLVSMGNMEENEEYVDITFYYAITRIGEKIITEISYEII